MLFCKPSPKADILYEHPFQQGQVIRFRSLMLKKDLNILHQWANQPYSRFWHQEGSIEKLRAAYQAVLKNPDAHSFVGILDEQLICLIDVHRVQADELGRHIECKVNDFVMRLLMAPSETLLPDLSWKVIQAFMAYLFSFTDSRYLYAEPDIHNTKVCRLLEKCGFSFLQNIMLSTKAASLYLMTPNQFQATHTNEEVS